MLLCSGLIGQTVSSSLFGTVLDPSGAAVPNAPVTLTDKDTGSVRTALTDGTGVFRFLNLSPGDYSVSVRASGFKGFTAAAVTVEANQTRDVGKVSLEIGSSTDTVTVMAEAQAVQLASSEKAQAIAGNQLNDITLKGRDLFGYLKLVPGVIDTTASRDVTSPNAIGGITINGNTSAKNFTVDGITDMDTGSNGTLHYEPNLDAIQEMKILTSNYRRNSEETPAAPSRWSPRAGHSSFTAPRRGITATKGSTRTSGRITATAETR